MDLYYETHGEGVPLMMIAGLASDSLSWMSVSGKLSQSLTLILPDNRGVGRSTQKDIDITVERMADDCIALAQASGFHKLNFLGHSMGGFVALDIALRYPEYVDRLIIAGSSASCYCGRNQMLLEDWALMLENQLPPEIWYRNLFYWIFTHRFFQNESMVSDAVRYSIQYPYPQATEAFRKQTEIIKSFNCKDRLRQIKAKTLVIAGEEDLLFPLPCSMEIASEIPDAEMKMIQGAAHSIHVEQPDSFISEVVSFLKKS